ncbi:MAG: TadE family protein [Thermodesulfobacteriota bacterium]|nr:TadE family protein [Thermodesulfobacteriota bacterium]
MSCHFRHRVSGLPRGSVTVEFAIIVAFILPVLIFGIIDLGKFVWVRQVTTEVSRLGGGKIFAREKKYGYMDINATQEATDLLNLLEDAGSPILRANNKDKWKIIVSKIEGAWQQGDTPMIVCQVKRGGMNINSAIGEEGQPPRQDALPHIYSHLEFDIGNQAPDKSELGVVEVFYKYEPITPLPNFIEGILPMDGGGVIIRSCKAFF